MRRWVGQPGAGAEAGICLQVSARPAHGESEQRGDRKAGVQEVPRGKNHRDGGLRTRQRQGASSVALKTPA